MFSFKSFIYIVYMHDSTISGFQSMHRFIFERFCQKFCQCGYNHIHSQGHCKSLGTLILCKHLVFFHLFHFRQSDGYGGASHFISVSMVTNEDEHFYAFIGHLYLYCEGNIQGFVHFSTGFSTCRISGFLTLGILTYGT